MASIEDRVTRLETLLETHLTKVVDGVSSLSMVMVEIEENKQFRQDLHKHIKKEIDIRLNSKSFDDAVRETVEETISVFLQRESVRDDFTKKVKLIVKKELESDIDSLTTPIIEKWVKNKILWVYLKVTGIVGGILLALVTAIVKGWI